MGTWFGMCSLLFQTDNNDKNTEVKGPMLWNSSGNTLDIKKHELQNISDKYHKLDDIPTFDLGLQKHV